MCMTVYYHYTNREALEGILKSRTIERSRSGRYGEGVYLTTLSPTEGKMKIAESNWDGAWKFAEQQGKLEYAIRVVLPDHKVEDCGGGIFLFEEDVDLDMTDVKLYSSNGDLMELALKCF